MAWTLDQVADLSGRIASAYQDKSASNIISIAFASGMTTDQIENQLFEREKINAALKEWREMEPRLTREIAQGEMSVGDWRFRGSEDAFERLVLEKIDAEKAKFLASKGIK